MNYKIRGRVPNDIEFITSRLLNYYKQYSAWGKSMSKDVFMKNHSMQLNKVLKHCRFHVACDPEEQKNILGFLITERGSNQDIIHFAFVKKDFRGKGIMTDLVKMAKKYENCIYTHKTSDKNVLLKAYKDPIFNPYRFLDGVNYV